MGFIVLAPDAHRARLASALVGAVLASSVLALAGPVAPATAADSLHNIPGVLLPASNVSGTLGGSTYDDVYRIQVPAGDVLLLAMTGTAGTDYDLYLFDASATNIYADPPVGLVGSSTGPTSTEFIRYASVAGGTYYIDLSAYSPAVGTFHLSVQVVAGATPPRVSLSLDGGAPATNEPLVTVSVVASGDLAGVVSMSFSQDGTTWTAPVAYATTAVLNLDGPDGPRTVWVRVTDAVGNTSPPAHATIDLDRTAPTVVARSPEAGATVTGIQPTISIRFSKAIQVSTWTNAGLILQDSSGTILYGTYGYDPSTFTGIFTPVVPLQAGATYVVSLGSVTDPAGNKVAPPGSWTFTPLLAPRLTLAVSQAVLNGPGWVTLSGRIDLWPGGFLNLESSGSGGAWTVVQPVIPGPDGSWSATLPVESNASFRVHFGGSQFAVETISPAVRVLVRRHVGLSGVDAGVTRRTNAGNLVVLSAQVEPSDPAVPVKLSIYRWVPGRGYVLDRSVTRTSVGGRYVFSWHPGRGTYGVRLTTPPTPLFANGLSPIYRWAVQ
jgi:hypothetical protein